MLIALTITCAVATLVLIGAEYAKQKTLRVLAKLVASASFVGLGFEAFQVGHDGGRVHYARVIFVGLVFGAIGDLALLGTSSRAFLAGLAAFLIGHLAYVVAASYLVPVGSWIGGAGVLTVVPVIAGGIALALLWPALGTLRVPVIAYVLAIVTMVIAAIAVWRTDALPEPQRTRLVLGASLFFLSDLAVARDKFVARSWNNKLWGLPAYFAGQLLIAWSVVGL